MSTWVRSPVNPGLALSKKKLNIKHEIFPNRVRKLFKGIFSVVLVQERSGKSNETTSRRPWQQF